jgi:hypothetical protein
MSPTDTERLIGDAAKNQVTMNPTNTVFGTCSAPPLRLPLFFFFKKKEGGGSPQ